ncbi:MAG: hypothetical protein CMF17_09990 [Idiomarinaceae bacterium]|nr:hypothetical protein [Idiomarinaceae bacterium]
MPKFLFAILLLSFSVHSVPLEKVDTVINTTTCYKGPFASHESWVRWLSQRPGFKIERFPFSKAQFDTFKSTLTCSLFIYDVDGVAVNGYIIYPKEAKTALPTLIYNRGGNTHYGMMNFGSMMYYLMPLAEQGFVVIGSQYRWSGMRKKAEDFLADGTEDQFGGIDVNDVLALIPIAEKLDIADTSRLGVYGASRGGMQSFLVAKAHQDIKAIAVSAGISDVREFYQRSDKTKLLLSKLIPDFDSRGQAALAERSAVLWADELPDAPVLLLHARDDKRVAFSQSQAMTTALKAAGKEVKFVQFETGGHDLSPHREEVQQAITKWFQTHL